MPQLQPNRAAARWQIGSIMIVTGGLTSLSSGELQHGEEGWTRANIRISHARNEIISQGLYICDGNSSATIANESSVVEHRRSTSTLGCECHLFRPRTGSARCDHTCRTQHAYLVFLHITSLAGSCSEVSSERLSPLNIASLVTRTRGAPQVQHVSKCGSLPLIR